MITEQAFTAALADPTVQTLASTAAGHLERIEKPPVGSCVDWAIEYSLGGQRLTYAEYYAVHHLITSVKK